MTFSIINHSRAKRIVPGHRHLRRRKQTGEVPSARTLDAWMHGASARLEIEPESERLFARLLEGDECGCDDTRTTDR